MGSLPPPAQRAAFTDPHYRGPVDGLEVLGRPESIHQAMAPADRAQLLGLYDAEIRFVDDNLADVVAAVEESGRLGSTIVVVTGDHGEEFFEDGRIGHRATLREEVLRVPLIFWGPGIVPEGRVVDDDVLDPRLEARGDPVERERQAADDRTVDAGDEQHRVGGIDQLGQLGRRRRR